jgi:hypothetical protein
LLTTSKASTISKSFRNVVTCRKQRGWRMNHSSEEDPPIGWKNLEKWTPSWRTDAVYSCPTSSPQLLHFMSMNSRWFEFYVLFGLWRSVHQGRQRHKLIVIGWRNCFIEEMGYLLVQTGVPPFLVAEQVQLFFPHDT